MLKLSMTIWDGELRNMKERGICKKSIMDFFLYGLRRMKTQLLRWRCIENRETTYIWGGVASTGRGCSVGSYRGGVVKYTGR